VGKLSQYDVFVKVNKEIIEQSPFGAAITMFAILLSLFLVISEIREYYRKDTYDVVSVDTIRDERIPIFFDISFFQINCREAYIDVVDEQGNQISNVNHNIGKIKIDRGGNIVNNEYAHTRLGRGGDIYVTCRICQTDKEIPVYNIGNDAKVCCTCHDVKEYYKSVGKTEKEADESYQCQYEKKYLNENIEGTGCRLSGLLNVDKVKGNFHLAAGSSEEQSHGSHSHHIHKLNPIDIVTKLPKFNLTHKINHLSFGNYLEGRKLVLDGHIFRTDKLVRHTYFIQVVPTLYVDGTTHEYTYQFSSMDNTEDVNIYSNHWHLPGIFFKYDFFPLRVKMTRKPSYLSHFLTRICAIVGGTWVVVGIIYNSISKMYTTIKKKQY